jgi:hypothetical protein
MHLGSTGCDGDPLAGGTTTCAAPNRVDVELDAFDPKSETVVADFAQLVAGASLDVNQQPEAPRGCMAEPTNGDCAALFENLGLSFAGSVPGTQQFFSVE